MSNPAVITLANAGKGKFKRFVIEDNIGEAIHLHIDNMRIDFTIKEFLEFSNLVRNSLKELDMLKGWGIDKFDEYFLNQCAPFFNNLISIKKEKIKLKNLLAIFHFRFRDLILQRIIYLNKTPAYKFLKDGVSDFVDYPQFNYFGITNEERLLTLKKSIEKNGYPYDNRYVILFNGQNIIRDGQHRAVILAYLYGLDYEIEILRFNFKYNKHIFKLSNNKEVAKWFAQRLYKKIKRYITNENSI